MAYMRREKPKKEFNESLIEVRRVTKVTTWWRRMAFRATMLIWDGKGKVGVGVAKGADVSIAVKKATREAYKNVVNVPITKANTVPYTITAKFKACRVKLIPASSGTGLKAGSSVRQVLELAGYENVLSKIIGSNNKLNNVLATLTALTSYKHAEHFNAQLDEGSKAARAKKEDDDRKANERIERKNSKKSFAKKAPAKKSVAKTEKKTEKKIEKKIEKKEEKKPAAKKAAPKKEEKKIEKTEDK